MGVRRSRNPKTFRSTSRVPGSFRASTTTGVLNDQLVVGVSRTIGAVVERFDVAGLEAARGARVRDLGAVQGRATRNKRVEGNTAIDVVDDAHLGRSRVEIKGHTRRVPAALNRPSISDAETDADSVDEVVENLRPGLSRQRIDSGAIDELLHRPSDHICDDQVVAERVDLLVRPSPADGNSGVRNVDNRIPAHRHVSNVTEKYADAVVVLQADATDLVVDHSVTFDSRESRRRRQQFAA